MTTHTTVREAASMLGVTERRVRFLVSQGRLKGEKMGRDWLIDRKSVQDRVSGIEKMRRHIEEADDGKA